MGAVDRMRCGFDRLSPRYRPSSQTRQFRASGSISQTRRAPRATAVFSVYYSIDMLSKPRKRELLYKFVKQFKRSQCLWNPKNIYYYHKPAKLDALLVLLKLWNNYEHMTLKGLRVKIQGIRSLYRRERKKVESSAAASVHYKPTLWYYKHLNFLSGNDDPDSDDSDSDPNEDTVYVQIPRGQKRPASTSIDQEIEPDTSIDASAAAFGRSVGAQLHHLSKMQRCIAEKLISDVIYYAKMDQLSLDTNIDVKEAADDPVNNILIPKAGPSWYDTDTALETGEQESSSSYTLHDTTEDLVKKEIAETESAVNFITVERAETENYYFQDDEEQNHAIDIIKEELM